MEGLGLMPDSGFWHGKKVLLTGHTGFKGSWLAIWLTSLGAEVTCLSLAPESKPNLYTLAGVAGMVDDHIGDIRDFDSLKRLVVGKKPEIVMHLAAQALVRRSYLEPTETFTSNIMGTMNVLEAIRHAESVRVAIMVTTDKVYEVAGMDRPFEETDRLGGHDPYSASKAASEIVISSYRDSFLAAQDVAVASARAGNVIGGGDWSADRLVPDAIRAWHENSVLEIRMPEAVRPWQHVLDPLSGYLKLAESLWQDSSKAGAFNFGPDAGNNATVRDVIETARRYYTSAEVHYGNPDSKFHETGVLSLDTGKASREINFTNRYGLDKALHTTFRWYQALEAGEKALDLCLSDIDEYGKLP